MNQISSNKSNAMSKLINRFEDKNIELIKLGFIS